MDSLVIKVFLILSVMLGVTALSAKRNKAFEHKAEFLIFFIVSIVLIFIIPIVGMPWNLLFTLVFAFIIGSILGPGIKALMLSYVTRQILKRKGYTKQELQNLSDSELAQKNQQEVRSVIENDSSSIINDWNNIFMLSVYSTVGITIATGTIVFGFNFDFSFLGQILFVSLLGLVIVGILNALFFKSRLTRLIGAYVGAVIFSLYLLYDFNRLKEASDLGDVSWETAIDISISIYLDIINLLLDLLEILASD